MALLDSLFAGAQYDPATFASLPGWLAEAGTNVTPAQWSSPSPADMPANARVAGAFQDMASGVPLPQARPADAPGFEGANAADLPTQSAPTSGQAPPGAAPPQLAIPPTSLLGRIGNAIGSNSNMLMALGAGMAGAPSIGTGISRGLAAAIPATQQDLRLKQLNMTVQALVNRGMPPDMAQVAALNPAVMQQILPRMFGVKQMQFTQIGEDMYGNKKYGFVDPVSGTVMPFQGSSPFGSTSGGQPGGVPGTGQIDSSLTGEDYLKQFPPEFQQAVKSYVAGESMPTGNPRSGLTQAVKNVAQKYGADIGMQADDTTYAARRQMRTQLSNAAKNSLGGQINTGNTAIGHLEDLSQKALDLGNWSALGPDISHVINTVRAHLPGQIGTDQAARVEALQGAAQHYGQEITSFYAGSPGGEAERNRFLSSINGAKTPEELAAVIQTEAELMRSRLGSIGSQIQGTLGDFGTKQYPVVRPEGEKAFGQIAANVARLRGNAPPQGQQPTTAAGADPLSQARDAIAKGAPRQAVINRLLQAGINPAGL